MSGLEVRGLRVIGPGGAALVAGLDLAIAPGEVLALIGRSGSGKSLAAAAILGLAPLPVAGEVRLGGRPLPPPGPGRGTGLVLQQPRRALNPIRPVGRQVADAGGPGCDVAGLLARVRFPPDRAGAYPFQLSGGLCQRAALAVALAGRPRLLVADEPTTDLDTVTQAAVLDAIVAQTRAGGLATLLITHDLALAAGRADQIAVMAAGRIVEEGPPARLLAAPRTAETARLAAAARPRQPPPPPAPGDVLLEAEGLARRFDGRIAAVEDATLTLRAGEAVALVGTSGSGKTTLARMLAGLERPDRGALRVRGEKAPMPWPRPLRGAVQIAFQDATGALDPRLTARQSIGEPLRHLCPGRAPEPRIRAAAEAAGLEPALLDRRPAALSGGQRARVGLARAVAPGPRVLILDEPTSALDAELVAGLLDRLDGLRRSGLALLLVTHDLGVAAGLCERLLVMEAGRIVEAGPTARLLTAPRVAATRALVAAAPALSPAAAGADPASGGR